jgi:hypothetical protein
MFDEQPVISFAAISVELHANKDPAAVEPFAIKFEFEIALIQSLLWSSATFRFPISPVPKLNRAPSILTFGDGSFKITIVERMVLDFDRKTPVTRIERGATGYCPRFEHSVQLQA